MILHVHRTRSWPEGVRPLDFEAVWEIVHVLLLPDDRGDSAIDQLTPTLSAVMVHEGSWTAAGTLATLLQEPDARVANLQGWVEEFAATDPLLEA